MIAYIVLVSDVETSFTSLKTGSQIGQGRRELRFLGVVDKATMFMQVQAAGQLRQAGKIGPSGAHLSLPIASK
jgi:hypothetical protein